MSEDSKRGETFSYTYSARQRQEIEQIRKKYLPEEEDKMAQIRRMDGAVTRKGTVISLMLGSASCLVLGLGMCCCMVWTGRWFVPGILLGLLGIAGMAAAYPLFLRVTKRGRERIAPQILKLTEELMKRQDAD